MMFNQLLESKPKKERSVGAQIVSAVLHVILIGGAVAATLHAKEEMEKPKQEEVKFVETPKEPPPPEPEKAPPPPDVAVAPPPPKGFQVLTAPVNIPDVIPDIDLNKKVTDEADFTGKGVAGGSSKGVVGGTAPVISDQPYFEFQVDKPATILPGGGAAPKYPEMLKSAGITGEVQVQFVVDTTGRADMSTFKVLKSAHELFTVAAKNAVREQRFYPAETGGRKVRMYVQEPFVFSINP
jgi:protein TonB